MRSRACLLPVFASCLPASGALLGDEPRENGRARLTFLGKQLARAPPELDFLPTYLCAPKSAFAAERAWSLCWKEATFFPETAMWSVCEAGEGGPQDKEGTEEGVVMEKEVQSRVRVHAAGKRPDRGYSNPGPTSQSQKDTQSSGKRQGSWSSWKYELGERKSLALVGPSEA